MPKHDQCETCTACENLDRTPIELTPCTSCGAKICDECNDSKGRCGDCSTYDLPDNFKILTYADGMNARKTVPEGEILAEVRILQFTGAGLGHFHIDIWELMPQPEEGMRTFRVDKCNTKEEVPRAVKKVLVEEYGDQKVWVRFYSDFGRQWFYREGD